MTSMWRKNSFNILLGMLLGLLIFFGGSADSQPVVGKVNVRTLPGDSVAVTFAPGGTIIANQGTANTQANRWPTFLSDGALEWGTVGNPFNVTGNVTAAQGARSAATNSWPVYVANSAGTAVAVVTGGGLGNSLQVAQGQGIFSTPVAWNNAPIPSHLQVVVAGAPNAIATLTLPAAGAGLFHYITYLSVTRVATAALAGGAILTVTSTNLPGAPTWRTGNTMAIVAPATGFVVLTDQSFPSPLKSSVANTATTIVGPAPGAAVSWHIRAQYYIGSGP